MQKTFLRIKAGKMPWFFLFLFGGLGGIAGSIWMRKISETCYPGVSEYLLILGAVLLSASPTFLTAKKLTPKGKTAFLVVSVLLLIGGGVVSCIYGHTMPQEFTTALSLIVSLLFSLAVLLDPIPDESQKEEETKGEKK